MKDKLVINVLLIGLALMNCLTSFGQNEVEKETAAIVEEGKMLYKLEITAWRGTDIFFEMFPEKKQNIGGYFAYVEDDRSKCIFYSKDKKPVIIGTISFDSSCNTATAIVKGDNRAFTEYERELHDLQSAAVDEMYSDTIFKAFENARFNLVLMPEKNLNKVYVFTASTKSGYVIFGNDYLLTFNKKNKSISNKNLHKNILYLEYVNEQEPDGVTIHTHSAETGRFITATDICTLMLYQELANWRQHIVVSSDYLSFWDCKKNQLGTMTMEAWEKYNSEQEKLDKD